LANSTSLHLSKFRGRREGIPFPEHAPSDPEQTFLRRSEKDNMLKIALDILGLVVLFENPVARLAEYPFPLLTGEIPCEQ
jgi:hypothetical protein